MIGCTTSCGLGTNRFRWVLCRSACAYSRYDLEAWIVSRFELSNFACVLPVADSRWDCSERLWPTHAQPSAHDGGQTGQARRADTSTHNQGQKHSCQYLDPGCVTPWTRIRIIPRLSDLLSRRAGRMECVPSIHPLCRLASSGTESPPPSSCISATLRRLYRTRWSLLATILTNPPRSAIHTPIGLIDIFEDFSSPQKDAEPEGCQIC